MIKGIAGFTRVLRLSSAFLLFTACIIFSSADICFAEKLGGIKGKIVDALTGKPISGVEVVALTDSNIESEQRYVRIKTISGKDGSFIIKGLRNYTYAINFSKANYFNRSRLTKTVPPKSNLIVKEPLAMYPLPTKWFELSDKTIKDKRTGLLWLRNIKASGPGFHTSPSNSETPYDFINQVNNSQLAGYNDWRLPSNEDFLSLCSTASEYVSAINGNAQKFGFNNGNDISDYFGYLKAVGFLEMEDKDKYVSSTNYRNKAHAEWLTFYPAFGGCSIQTNGTDYLYVWLNVWPVRGTNAIKVAEDRLKLDSMAALGMPDETLTEFMQLRTDMAMDYSEEDMKYSRWIINGGYPTTCSNNENLRKLVNVRNRLYRYVPRSYSKQSGQFVKTVTNRSPQTAEQLLKMFRDASSMLADIKKLGGDFLIKELLVYHGKIVATGAWEQKFKVLADISKNVGQLDNGKIFHSKGFPPPSEPCYMNNGDNDASIEAWLYSFWLRRYQEGNMTTTFEILKVLDKQLSTN